MMFTLAATPSIDRPRSAWRALLLAGLAFVLAAVGARASAQDGDPPGRAGRISEVAGQVWLLPAETDEWVAAGRNQVVTTGDRLATEAGARAEVQVGSTTLRVDSASEVEVVRLDDNHFALQLVSGSAYARLRDAADAGEFELSTDDGRFRALRAGRYRFDHKDNASHLTVYDGQAVYEGQNSALTLNPGQHAEFWIDQNNTAQYAMSGPFNDTFAAWINQRDPAPVQGPAMQYVSPEMTGADDLDRYGTWEQSDDYGALWTPTAVAVDWAPYRAGHWAWVRPWGWTWVDDAPWGFAPFHYGRWVRYRERWCWTPGQRVVRPVYAPALVAWVGGPNVSVSVRVGGAPGPAVGWFPLAPREVYVPSYRVSPRYVQNINITHVRNVTVINNVYRNPTAPRDFANRRYPGALTVVPAGVLTGREPVAPAASRWRDAPWARDIANRPPPTVIAPPVAAPVIAPRSPDRPATRPPGFPPPAAQAGAGQGGRGGANRRPGDDRPPTSVAAPGLVLPHTTAPVGRPGADQRPDGRPDRPVVARPEPRPDLRPPPTGPDAAGTQDAARPGLVLPHTERDGRNPGNRPAPPTTVQAPAPAPQVAPTRPVMTPAIPQPQIPGMVTPGGREGGREGGRVDAPRNPREGVVQRPDRVERPVRDPNDRSAGQPLPHTVQAQPQFQPPVQRAPQPQVQVPQPQPQPQPQPHAVQQPRAAEAPRPQAPEVRRPEAPRARAEAARENDPRERGGGKKDQ